GVLLRRAGGAAARAHVFGLFSRCPIVRRASWCRRDGPLHRAAGKAALQPVGFARAIRLVGNSRHVAWTDGRIVPEIKRPTGRPRRGRGGYRNQAAPASLQPHFSRCVSPGRLVLCGDVAADRRSAQGAIELSTNTGATATKFNSEKQSMTIRPLLMAFIAF